MSFVFEQGQSVCFDNGVIFGVGKIVGVSSSSQPVIGCTYMIGFLEVIRGPEIPNEEYPFETIAVCECHIRPTKQE